MHLLALEPHCRLQQPLFWRYRRNCQGNTSENIPLTQTQSSPVAIRDLDQILMDVEKILNVFIKAKMVLRTLHVSIL